jgi:L-ascorbate metabolism protein UlaG (beta-lactamase superfamily)
MAFGHAPERQRENETLKAEKGDEAMHIEWIGHACFCITSETGIKIVTDPYESGLGGMIKYAPVETAADIVTVSHEHGDHNHVAAVSGSPVVLRGADAVTVKGIPFRGMAVYHDQDTGAKAGANTIFTFTVDGIRVTHLGDLGHPLSPEQLQALQGTDVLLAPIGGAPATLDLDEVVDLWEKLKPSVVIPMHFKSDKCPFPKYELADLEKLRPAARKTGASALRLSKEDLSHLLEIVVLEPLR